MQRFFPLLKCSTCPWAKPPGTRSQLRNEFIRRFKPKELEEVHFLFSSSPGPFIIHTAKKPVNTLEDLKGLKIRTSGPIEAVVRTLGATPVSMPVTETYDALQKGVVDGVLLPTEALLNYRIAEVTTYTTYNYGAACGSLSIYAMNRRRVGVSPGRSEGHHRCEQGVRRIGGQVLGRHRQRRRAVRTAKEP
jgi:hypothetical protein